MTTYTDKIGVGGGFASLSLWHGTSASVPVSGDIMNVEFLSGTHDIGGIYNNFTATDITINLKAHASALHNGEWDGPVQITWSTRPDWYFDDQTINLNLNDLVIKMTSNNFLLWNHVGTSGSSAGYDSNITFNRCLISNWSQDYSFISVSYVSLFDGPAASPTAYGTFKWEMNNCVVEQQNTARNLLFNSDSGVTNPYYAQKRYFNGCTFKNVSFNDRSTDNGPLDVQVSGCMNDSGTTRLVPVITASPYTATVTDYITSEANTGAQFNFWATGTNTNVSTAASFNYDGTVTAGEVCFVGPSGPEGNYRLVADADNLAVKYATNSTLPTLDVSRYNRPGLTDAGAFQSISTDNVINVIGSGVDGVSADFATISLWYGDRRTEVLNGATEIGALQSQTHAYDGSYNVWDEVNFTACLSGQTHHNGNWDEGAKLLNAGSRLSYTWANQSVEYKFEDLVYEVEQTSYGSTWNHNVTNTDGSGFNSDVTFRRCLVTATNQNADNTFFYMTVDLSAVESIGTQNTTLENSLFVLGRRGGFSNEGRGSNGYDYNVYNRVVGTTIDTTMQGTFIGQRGVINGVTNGDVIGSLYHTENPFRTLMGNCTLVDYISNETNHNYATSTVNSLAAQTFTFDNTVTNGAVCFVGSGYEGDYRLVADPDNLPVRYMDLSSIYLTCSKDITGRKRPGSTDAGAFQSVSNRVVSASIGPDSSNEYGTAAIWINELDGSSVLNGDTFLLRTDAGLSGANYVYANIGYGNAGTIKVLTMEVDHTIHFKSKEPVNGDWSSGTVVRSSDDLSNRIGLGNFKALRNNFNLIYEDFVLSGDSNQLPNNTGCIELHQFHGDYPPTWWNSYGQEIVSKTRVTYDNSVKLKNCMVSTYDMRNPIVRDLYDSRIVDSNGNTTYGKGTWDFENCVILGDSAGLGVLSIAGSLYSPITGYDVKVKGSTLVNCLGSNHLYNSPDGTHYYIDGSLIITGLSGLTESTLYADYFFGARWHYSTRSSTIHINDSIFSQASADLVPLEYGQVAGSGMLENSIASGFVTNAQYDVPFNFDGSVSAGTVSFVDGSSGVNNYRLVGSEDNFASGYVSSFALSGLDLAGNDRGDSPYDAGAFAITPEDVEDFIKSLGGPLVLQVGYRISNNRQIFIPVIGGGE